MVSIIITTFGGSDKLIRAIKSCQNQTYSNIEILVIDDNNPNTMGRKTTEMNMETFKDDLRVKYIKHSKNMNGSTARNTGIFAAKGEYICFLDDDDIYLPFHIKNNLDFLEKQNCDGVCCGVVYTNCSKNIVGYMIKKRKFKLDFKDILTGKTAIGTGSNIFLKKDLITSISGFDTGFQRFQDLEFMIRASKNGIILFNDSIQIIKDRAYIRNVNYEMYKDAVSVFENRFKNIIDGLSKFEKKEFARYFYGQLFSTAINSGTYGNILEAGNKLEEYNILDDEKMKYVKYARVCSCISKIKRNVLEKKFNKIFYYLKCLKESRLDRKLERELGRDLYLLIHNLICE